ncbi:MAG TPA: radical SAM protein [Thermoleophilaceae bacterium]|nr:radical SAM protein [Thermoleophilaceae bacterium]
MIGTRLDDVDAPRLIESEHGWWFIGNRTWTLLDSDLVGPDGTVDESAQAFLVAHGAYRPRVATSFSLTVLTTTSCNLGCGYCFQNTALDPSGGNRPLRIDRRRLDAGTVDRIVGFTAERMARAGLDKLHLLLFGGEPLLNPPACLRLLDGARGIGLDKAFMTTNGVLLTEELAKDLDAAGLDGAQITFDGSREDHDQIRVKRSGAGTFDAIVRNVALATEVTDLGWNLRVNVSHHSFDRIGELFSQLEGRVDPARCTVTFAWVGDAGFGYGNALRHVDDVSDGFVAWSVAALEAGFDVTRPSMKTTCQICSVPGAAHGAVVNADGVLYSCWQSAGKPGFDVGTIDDGYLEVSEVPDRWVTCGYEYEQEDGTAAAEFQDRVDGRVLDYLYDSGRLGHAASAGAT